MNVGLVFQKLQELVFDENRIVTYKTLSKVCCIHISNSKKNLEDFFNSEDGLNASYLLSGFVKNDINPQDSLYRVAVVPGSKLDDFRKKFSQLDSCHIYSIQKSSIKDSSVLYSASNDDITQGTERLVPVIQNTHLSRCKRTPSVVTKTSTMDAQKMDVVKEKKPVPAMANISTPDPQTESPKTQDRPTETKAGSKGKGHKAGGNAGIMAAFARVSTANNKKSTPGHKENLKHSKPDQKKNISPNGDTSCEKKVIKKESQQPSINNSIKKAEKEMWSSNESSDEEVVPVKKKKVLRRIKQFSDSEDESDLKSESTLDSEEPIPTLMAKKSLCSDDEPASDPTAKNSLSSDDEEVIPPTPQGNKTCRQVVTVTNTYQDEEGFLVTRKEHKLEEVSLPEPKKVQTTSKTGVKSRSAPQPKSKQKNSPTEGVKRQASLMSFFSKK